MAERGRRGNYWDPHRTIRLCDGVTKSEYITCDEYRGTAESLVQSGILDVDMLPGQPGRARVGVSYRPLDVDRGERDWCELPGFMKVQRYLDGQYVVQINVDDSEWRRRQALHEAHLARLDEEHKARLARRAVVNICAARPARSAGLRLIWSAPRAG